MKPCVALFDKEQTERFLKELLLELAIASRLSTIFQITTLNMVEWTKMLILSKTWFHGIFPIQIWFLVYITAKICKKTDHIRSGFLFQGRIFGSGRFQIQQKISKPSKVFDQLVSEWNRDKTQTPSTHRKLRQLYSFSNVLISDTVNSLWNET